MNFERIDIRNVWYGWNWESIELLMEIPAAAVLGLRHREVMTHGI